MPNSLCLSKVLFPVINNTIRAVSCLSRMESTHKVRCIWVSAVVYVLQEAPELAIRKLFLALCNNTTQVRTSKLSHEFLTVFMLGIKPGFIVT